MNASLGDILTHAVDLVVLAASVAAARYFRSRDALREKVDALESDSEKHKDNLTLVARATGVELFPYRK